MLKVEHKGDFKNLERFLTYFYRKNPYYRVFEKYGDIGVEALREYTPKLTGATSQAWEYKVEKKGNNINLIFYNNHRVNGVPIAVIIQYGHATGSGRYIQGRDYINPAIQPIFDMIVEDLWREVCEA